MWGSSTSMLTVAPWVRWASQDGGWLVGGRVGMAGHDGLDLGDERGHLVRRRADEVDGPGQQVGQGGSIEPEPRIGAQAVDQVVALGPLLPLGEGDGDRVLLDGLVGLL